MTNDRPDQEGYGCEIAKMVSDMDTENAFDLCVECIRRVGVYAKGLPGLQKQIHDWISEIENWRHLVGQSAKLQQSISKVKALHKGLCNKYDRTDKWNSVSIASPEGVLYSKGGCVAEAILNLLMWLKDGIASDDSADFCGGAIAAAWTASAFSDNEKQWQVARIRELSLGEGL